MALRELQKRVREMDEKFGWTDDTPLQNLAHLSEEVGEVARLLLEREGYKTPKKDDKELGEELVDVLYLTLKIANHFDIDLDDAWARAEKKYGRKSDG